MPKHLVLVLLLALGCGGESATECKPEGGVNGAARKWSPGKLGLLAWWQAETPYVTLSSGNLTRWRNRVDGRSGVLIDVDGQPPAWSASPRNCLPMVEFDSADRLREETSFAASGRATVIDYMQGTNKPFSVLMTVRPTLTAGTEQVLWNWASNATSALINLKVTTGNVLKVTRQDDAASFADLTGTIQVGTAIRRIAATFDGTSLTLFQDAQVDNATALAGGQGAITPNAFRVGAQDASVGMQLGEIVVVPRAINYNEWLAYYAYSLKRWGTIQPPSFAGAGTGASGAGAGTLTPSYPSSPPAGALFVLHVAQYVEVAEPTVPAGWSLWDELIDGNIKQYTYFRDARAAGTETGTINVGVSATVSIVRMYQFTRVTGALTIAGYLESDAPGDGGASSCAGPTISPNGYGRLAVALYAGVGTNATANTGSSGGTWDEAAEYDADNLFLQVQIASIQNPPIPITGGTTTWTTGGGAESLVHGFALIGE